MSRAVFVLRPEPGGAQTVARLRAAGLEAVRLPLFEVRALRWEPPDPGRFDALILTSANTLRHGGAGLARLAALPVYAVGAATAAAARAAGLDVVVTGSEGAAALIVQADAAGVRRALHLSGRDRTDVADRSVVQQRIAVYASVARKVAPGALAAVTGNVVLIHSARAAGRLALLARRHGVSRAKVRLGALSAGVAAAAGTGWEEVATAASPDDRALVAVAHALAD